MITNICLFFLICSCIFFLIFGLGLEILLTTNSEGDLRSPDEFGANETCRGLWCDESFSNTNTDDAITTKYDIKYSPSGVQDIIRVNDTNANVSLTYIDDITRRNTHRITCPPGFINDKTKGCIKSCPSGQVYDSKLKNCAPTCLPFQKVSYTDSSASCTAKCWDIQYYDIFSGNCYNCPIGYTGDGNNNCIPTKTCATGQKVIDNYGNCTQCTTGQYVDSNNKCKDICPSYQHYNADGSCTLKCPNQNQYSDPLYGCINCPTGYLVDGSNVCQPHAPCPEGTFLDNAGINCVSECAVYDNYDSTKNLCVPICSGTTPIYDQYSKSCVPCPEGQIYSGSYNKCKPAPTLPPPTCGPGFVMGSNQGCQSICPDWRVNDTSNPSTCDLRCPLKTQYYDDKTLFGCVDCPTGFTVDAYNECTVPVPTTPPPTCGPGYYLNTTTKTCTTTCPYWRSNDPTNPKNCIALCPSNTQRYDNQFNFGCEECPKGYAVDNKNECTIILPTIPPPLPSQIIINNNIPTSNNSTNTSSGSGSSSGSSTIITPVPTTPVPTTPAPTTPPCLYANRAGHYDDYTNTCRILSISSDGIITAQCEDFNQRWPVTTYNSCNCPGRIQNIGGVLTCR